MLEKYLTLPSRLEEVATIEQVLEEVNSRLSVREDVYANIVISTTEAVNNAILHGNSNNPSKHFTFAVQQITPYLISFQVGDEGPGFNPEGLPDPTSPENILKENGRGIFIIKTLADVVKFHDNGRCIEMQFNI